MTNLGIILFNDPFPDVQLRYEELCEAGGARDNLEHLQEKLDTSGYDCRGTLLMLMYSFAVDVVFILSIILIRVEPSVCKYCLNVSNLINSCKNNSNLRLFIRTSVLFMIHF